jgi:hypothetical protein
MRGCTGRLDRVRFSAERDGPKDSGNRRVQGLEDFRAKPQGKIATYSRVRSYETDDVVRNKCSA